MKQCARIYFNSYLIFIFISGGKIIASNTVLPPLNLPTWLTVLTGFDSKEVILLPTLQFKKTLPNFWPIDASCKDGKNNLKYFSLFLFQKNMHNLLTKSVFSKGKSTRFFSLLYESIWRKLIHCYYCTSTTTNSCIFPLLW